MRLFLFVLALLMSTNALAQSREITGTVKAKSDRLPLPGATIVISGTDIGTISDFDGRFNITVPDSLSVLKISYLGFKSNTQRIPEAENDLDILLKEDCTICFFDFRDLGISYFGGIKYVGKGFLFDMTLPTYLPLDGPLQLKYGYQTNFKDNEQQYFEVGLPHFFADCGFRADLLFSHSQITNTILAFDYRDYRIEGAAEFKLFKDTQGKIYAGYGTSQINQSNIIQKRRGYELGLGKFFRYNIEVYAKTTYWEAFWQYQAGLEWQYRRYKLQFQFNKIDAYSEFNLGIGYKLF